MCVNSGLSCTWEIGRSLHCVFQFCPFDRILPEYHFLKYGHFTELNMSFAGTKLKCSCFWNRNSDLLSVKYSGDESFSPLHFLVQHLSPAFLIVVINAVLGRFPGKSSYGFWCVVCSSPRSAVFWFSLLPSVSFCQMKVRSCFSKQSFCSPKTCICPH